MRHKKIGYLRRTRRNIRVEAVLGHALSEAEDRLRAKQNERIQQWQEEIILKAEEAKKNGENREDDEAAEPEVKTTHQEKELCPALESLNKFMAELSKIKVPLERWIIANARETQKEKMAAMMRYSSNDAQLPLRIHRTMRSDHYAFIERCAAPTTHSSTIQQEIVPNDTSRAWRCLFGGFRGPAYKKQQNIIDIPMYIRMFFNCSLTVWDGNGSAQAWVERICSVGHLRKLRWNVASGQKNNWKPGYYLTSTSLDSPLPLTSLVCRSYQKMKKKNLGSGWLEPTDYFQFKFSQRRTAIVAEQTRPQPKYKNKKKFLVWRNCDIFSSYIIL